MTEDEDLVARLKAGDRSTLGEPAEAAMLDYVEKLTLRPWELGAGDTSALQAAGYSDADILDICQVAAYYAFVNRLALGLGVELESHRQERA